MGMQDSPAAGPTMRQPQAATTTGLPGMPPPPDAMPNPMPTTAQFALPGTPDITSQNMAPGGQTNDAMMTQLHAMMSSGQQPQDILQALSQGLK